MVGIDWPVWCRLGSCWRPPPSIGRKQGMAVADDRHEALLQKGCEGCPGLTSAP